MLNITLKEAIVISLAIHAAVLLPLYGSVPHDSRSVNTKPTEVEYIRIKDSPKFVEAPKTELVNKVDTRPSAEVSEARIRSTKDYINYYVFIREKIRSCIKDMYGSRSKDGEVSLAFTLDSSGALINAGVDESGTTADKQLVNIAIMSIKEASPFPAFPKAINLPRMSFNLTIEFRRR